MRISWREILGLLIGLVICYGVVSYALTSASQYREVASEKKGESAQQGVTSQQTTPTVSDENSKTLTIRITGSKGESFGANFGNRRSSRSVESTVPADYEVQVNTDLTSSDYVSATVWKTTGDSKELKVQILDNGKVLKEASTDKDYGATGARWSPSEPQPAETTTVTEKKARKEGGTKP